MTTFLIIIIAILLVVCFGLWLAMRDYKSDLIDKKSDYKWAMEYNDKLSKICCRRGILLTDISRALPNDLQGKNTRELSSGLWQSIQEDIEKELKLKA